MIAYVQSSLFVSPARALVNTVNTVGVMGKGIAKAFRDVYPEMFEEYRRRCERKEIAPGVLQVFSTPHKSIVNFPTKRHWRQPSQLEDIEAGLRTFAASYAEHGLTSVAFPQLGCGNGGLDWQTQVRPLMEDYLASLPIDVYLHVPTATGQPPLPEGWNNDRVAGWLRGVPEPVAFADFCRALGRELTSRSASGDLDGWSVDLDEGSVPPRLVFACMDHSVEVSQDFLFTVWRQLSVYGLIAADDLPLTICPIAPILMRVLGELPWLERAVWASDEASLGTVESYGVQYLPPATPLDAVSAAPRQAGLFAEAAVA